MEQLLTVTVYGLRIKFGIWLLRKLIVFSECSDVVFEGHVKIAGLLFNSAGSSGMRGTLAEMSSLCRHLIKCVFSVAHHFRPRGSSFNSRQCLFLGHHLIDLKPLTAVESNCLAVSAEDWL